MPKAPSSATTSGHSEKLQRLADAYFKSRVGGTELVNALGCSNLQYGGRSDIWRLAEPEQPNPEDEALVTKILLNLFFDPLPHAPEIEMRMSIMDGLGKNSRWLGCLRSEAGAYLLATYLVELPHAHEQTMNNEGGSSLQKAIMRNACAILNEWLSRRPIGEPPHFIPSDLTAPGNMGSLDIACAIFGSIWCDIALPTNEIAFWERTDIIAQQRPFFLPGLLPEHLAPVAPDLPSMDAP